MDIRNQNDFSDAAALGPSQMGMTLKTKETYTEKGLPRPPAGWNRVLGITDESIAEAPDTRSDDRD